MFNVPCVLNDDINYKHNTFRNNCGTTRRTLTEKKARKNRNEIVQSYSHYNFNL